MGEGEGKMDDAARLRVLVVDDDPSVNRLLRIRLAARGYQVDAAINGEEALALLEGVPPDLLLLDVSMPAVGGLEVLERIRARQLDTAVIMTTAYGSEQVAIDALRRGADDYLRKPFEPSEFQAVLERTVARLRLSRQNAELRRQLDEKHQQLEVELMRAAEVQAGLLPQQSPSLPGFDLAAWCVPARQVGGDFYDWHEPVHGMLTLAFGDVMGKGMPAALLMATTRSAMRAVVRQSAPALAMQYVSGALDGDFVRSGGFVTLFLGQLDVSTRRLDYVDAGHGLVFLRRAGGEVETLEPRGLPLGVLDEQMYEDGSVTMRRGDALVVYSDGLLDFCPDAARSPALLADQLEGATSAQEMVDRLMAKEALSESLPDDLTVLVLRCCEEAGAPMRPAASLGSLEA